MVVQSILPMGNSAPNATEEAMDLGEWMKISDAARYYKKSTKTIYDWIASGYYPTGEAIQSRQHPRTGVKEVYVPENHLLDMEPDKDDQMAELVKKVCSLSELVVTTSKELADTKIALHEKSTALVLVNNDLAASHQALKRSRNGQASVNPLKTLLRRWLEV